MQTASCLLHYRKLAVAIALCCGSTSVVLAQNVEEIQVTGTRIRQTDGMATPVPITAITADELQNFEPGAGVAQQLDAVPQFISTQTSQKAANTPLPGNQGGSFLNLRGLGNNRTLVLFDGSRVVPGDKFGSVNVDTFPTALIRTVDVVTGGASAAYGADAVGGAVNFVLNREFEGVKFQSGTGITEWGDGQRWNLSLAGGTKVGDNLHLIGSLEARHINQVLRDPTQFGSWYQRVGVVTNPAWSPGAPIGTPQRLTLPWVTSSENNPTGVIWARSGPNSNSPLIPFDLNGMTFLQNGSAVRPYVHGDVYAAPNAVGTTKTMSGGPEGILANNAFNGGPNLAEVTQRSAFSAVKYDFTDKLFGFAQIMLGRSESANDQTIAGHTGANLRLRDNLYATVFRNNAFLPADVAAAMDRAGIDSFQLHKNGSFPEDLVLGKGALNKVVYTTYSWSVGVDVELPKDWNLRTSWQSGRADKRAGVYDEIRVDRMFLAMDAVRDPKTGAIVCNVQLYNPTPAQLAASPSVAGRFGKDGKPLQSPIGLDNVVRDCVPFNIMGSKGVTDAVNNYITTPKIDDGYVDQDFAEALLTGDLFQAWAGPVSFAGGLTWRKQSFADKSLPESIDLLGPPLNAPELGIRGIPTGYTGGGANLHAFSTVPNISGQYDVWEWFSEINMKLYKAQNGPQSLGGSLAYRSSDYSSVGRIASWKMGLDFQAFDDLRLRATKSRDVREAAFNERFDARGGGGIVNDPRFNNIPAQISSISGGNPDLKPEVADTVVFGFVYQPSWLNGLQVSTDWYDVKIHDAVGQLGLQRIVNECEVNHVTALCAQIDRNPDGSIGIVRDTFLNVAQARVKGVDLEFSYRMEPNFFANQKESFNIRGLVGYIAERSDTPLGGKPLDVAGGINTPDLTSVVTANYSVGPYGFQLQQRYIARTIRDVNWVEGVDIDINTIASGNWTNGQISYTGDMNNGGTWNLAFNVQNLFDRHPPTLADFNNNYDVLGRRYQVSFGMQF
ncbi:MAG: TonB-dependent receptor [Pseudomonadales bacterium]|jgi:outer membrane receptor protein involved in Fe transport|nr:TonB-dependent receptor [Pseudomonadales bacterium]